MEPLSPFFAAWYPRVLALLRIVMGYLLFIHGTAKMFHVPNAPMFENLQPWSLPWYAGFIELAGGALLMLGLATRPTAFVLSGLCAFAYFIGHASKGTPLMPLLNGGDLAVVWCFLFLFMSVAGPGAWALDRFAHPRSGRLVEA